jgi:hypothetical protein
MKSLEKKMMALVKNGMPIQEAYEKALPELKEYVKMIKLEKIKK